MTTLDYVISTISSGLASLAVIVDGERDCVATLERNDIWWPGITSDSNWMAIRSPSHADAMANQHDRMQYAVAWGRTRKECAENFLKARHEA